jgi:hypothetical protein
MKVNEVECDGCGTRKRIDESSEHTWLTVATAVSANEYAEVMEKLHQGETLESLVDNGDFCSLVCLANWASLRANMRELDGA